jgi:S1-C subfamily serine protease
MRLPPVAATLAASLFALASCTGPAPAPDPTPPNRDTYRYASARISAVVITESDDISRWVRSRFALRNAPVDADGGSAAPITPDGYFLTADHVLNTAFDHSAGSNTPRKVFVIYGRGDQLQGARARIVWRSRESDLALLKAPIKTPRYYQFTPESQWLPAGTPIIHAGIATGFDSKPGKLASSIPPDGSFGGRRRFKHDIPLRPGDSGGAVLDARGRLVGVNSAVEFLVPLETAFFIESEGNRPNPARINKVIESDRARNGSR